MAFLRQPLLITETVPHKAYETVEGNLQMDRHIDTKQSNPFKSLC